mmetsp:Transcript_30303/g.64996  ORF Transcript_30303/g.64996 Transcript_30303/m.64996 type:complete len:619 (-) Transcript_30303:191-2047(-)
MKTPGLWYTALFLAGIILVATRDCSAFPPKTEKQGGRARVPFQGRGHPLTFFDHESKGSGRFDLSASSSDFSPDANARRKIKHQHRVPLHASSIADYDRNRNRAASETPIARAVDTAWNSVSGKFTVLTPTGRRMRQRRRLLQQRRRLSSGLVVSSSARAAVAVREPEVATKTDTASPTKTAVKEKLSKLDIAVFATYFCNIAVVTLSVVTVPAIAMEHNLSPQATAAFCASMAGMAPLGGFVGKLVNGFVCQRLGGQRSSWMYLVALSMLSMGMSFSRSLGPVALCLIGFDFLSSIQWVSNSAVLTQHYRKNPALQARGFTILSLASTLGALAAKTFGAGLLQATQWRTVARVGSVTGLVGAAAMYYGCTLKPTQNEASRIASDGTAKTASSVSAGGQQRQSPLASLKAVLSNPIFWMVGLGHSLGHITRVSDRLLAPFLQEVGGISSSMAVGLTSSVTIGFVLGLFRGSVFSKLDSIKGKMDMIKRSYVVTLLSVLGLAGCGIKGAANLVGGNSNAILALITLFSGMIASTVSFQFYQFPNLVSSTVFPENSAVALSLTDAVGFLVTAGVMGLNSRVLGDFGWCASWGFLAMVFAIASFSMTKAVQPVLIQSMKKN